ncbi:MAG: SPASM domain-containing protein [Bacteroidales bacterium]|nr:SPASM domain-containing protein [Bacteroidales bacterium]
MIYITRIINFIQIIITYFLSVVFRKVYVSQYPFALSIEPTNCCQLNCAECPTGMQQLTRVKGYIDMDVFEKILQSVYTRTFYLNLYFQGEPLLHHNILYMIRLAKKYNMNVVISTNGQMIDDNIAKQIVQSGLDKIIISLDGFSQQSYEAYRKGGDVLQTKHAIISLIKAKKELKKSKPKIIIQTLVNRFNEHEIPIIKQWVNTLKGTTFRLKSMQINYSYEFLPHNEIYRRYTKKNGNWKIKKRLNNRCFRIWSQCVITHEGNVVPCCYDKNAEFIMGNITHAKLSEIWRNKKFTNFRKKILTEREKIFICTNCTE